MAEQWRVVPPSQWAPRRYYLSPTLTASDVEKIVAELARWAGDVELIFVGGIYRFARSIRVPRPINRIRVRQQAACTVHLPDGVPLFVRADWDGHDSIQGDPTVDWLDLTGTHWSIMHPEGRGVTGVTYLQNDLGLAGPNPKIPHIPSTRR